MSKQSEDIKLIRNMMERSTKFLVFSSLSPIFAGFVALVGAIYTYFYLQNASTETFQSKLYVLLPVALLVLSISVVATILFSNAKAKRLKQKLWSKTSARTLYNLAVQMLAGALFASSLSQDAGYVLVLWQGWQLQTGVGFFLLLLLCIAVLLVLLLLFFSMLSSGFGHQKHNQQQAQQQLLLPIEYRVGY